GCSSFHEIVSTTSAVHAHSSCGGDMDNHSIYEYIMMLFYVIYKGVPARQTARDWSAAQTAPPGPGRARGPRPPSAMGSSPSSTTLLSSPHSVSWPSVPCSCCALHG